MNGFDNACGPKRVELLHESVGDLGGESLLDLRPAGIAVYEAGEFAQSNHLAVGKIGNMGPAGERQQVMLAHGMEFDIAEKDDFIVSFAEYSL
jgi:hypothetical protein